VVVVVALVSGWTSLIVLLHLLILVLSSFVLLFVSGNVSLLLLPS